MIIAVVLFMVDDEVETEWDGTIWKLLRSKMHVITTRSTGNLHDCEMRIHVEILLEYM